MGAGTVTKSSIMVGLGEAVEEVRECLRDLRACDVDIVTLGQYLQPSRDHLPVHRYYSPQEFGSLESDAAALGFRYVEAGPLVRSSYHAERQSSMLPVRAP
jgi:lipoic acid synthetase